MNTVFKIITFAIILCAVAPSKAMLSRLSNTVRTAAINRTLITKPFNKSFTCRLMYRHSHHDAYEKYLTARIDLYENSYQQIVNILKKGREDYYIEPSPDKAQELFELKDEIRRYGQEILKLKHMALGIDPDPSVRWINFSDSVRP